MASQILAAPDAGLHGDLESHAGEVAGILRELANDRRLLILCHLTGKGEMRVGELAEALQLSQSALSQHLARLRDEKLVTFRREGQTLWYRIADRRVEDLMGQLHRIFCTVDSGVC